MWPRPLWLPVDRPFQLRCPSRKESSLQKWYRGEFVYNHCYLPDTNFKVYNYYFLSHACKYSGSWKTKQFKSYNFNSLGMPPQAGHLHPLMKVRAEIRQIFLEMGSVVLTHILYKSIGLTIQQKQSACTCTFRFTEMPTNNFVESSFWNFDALFQPQQHPARDAHDTFFMKGACSYS